MNASLPKIVSPRVAILALALAGALTGFGQSDPVPSNPPGTHPALPRPPLPSRPSEDFKTVTNSTPNRATERVLAKVSMASSEALRLSQIATERASNAQVRSFADQVTSSSQALEQEIDQIAISRNVTVPTGKEANDMAVEDDWRKKDARDFDEDYIRRTVKLHQDAIDALEDYAQERDADPEVAAIAQKHLPSLREHLRQAQSLRRQVD